MTEMSKKKKFKELTSGNGKCRLFKLNIDFNFY